jgi:hypothetical protein
MKSTLADAVMKLAAEENRLEEEHEFRAWCDGLLALDIKFHRELNDDWIADLEVQPLRWMNAGLTLIHSGKITGFLQLANGVQGPPANIFLPYPIFHAGAEIFLKGMWLCRYKDCRMLDSSTYVSPERRAEMLEELKNLLGHNLINILGKLRAIPKYQKDANCRRFFDMLSAIIRRDYFPVFAADKRGNEWASSRYPKRFYDDDKQLAAADTLNSYPPANFVLRIFRDAERHVDRLWRLRAALLYRGHTH